MGLSEPDLLAAPKISGAPPPTANRNVRREESISMSYPFLPGREFLVEPTTTQPRLEGRRPYLLYSERDAGQLVQLCSVVGHGGRRAPRAGPRRFRSRHRTYFRRTLLFVPRNQNAVGR